MYLLQSAFRLIYLKTNVSALGNGDWKGVSFDNRTQFSKGSNVWDTTRSNFDHIIPGDTCVSCLQQYRHSTIKWMILPLEMLDVEIVCGNSHLVLKENNAKDSQASKFHAIMPALTCVSFIQHDSFLFLTMNVSPTWKGWQIWSIPLTS
jgi:hypothetical protein